jgi:disulfide bond formation protein, dsbB family
MSFFNEKNFDFVMATAVLLMLAIPVGIANIYLGYVIGEGPCTLCWWERIGMGSSRRRGHLDTALRTKGALHSRRTFWRCVWYFYDAKAR